MEERDDGLFAIGDGGDGGLVGEDGSGGRRVARREGSRLDCGGEGAVGGGGLDVEAWDGGLVRVRL